MKLLKALKLGKGKSVGQSLVEIIVVIGVTGVALVAVALAATISTRNARIAQERSEARNHAMAMLESVRAERDADPEAFFAAGSRTVELSIIETLPSYQRRLIYTEIIAGQKIQVQAEVTWAESDNVFSLIEETTLERYSES
jgi:type II secretory pathway pseudopilin PulG